MNEQEEWRYSVNAAKIDFGRTYLMSRNREDLRKIASENNLLRTGNKHELVQRIRLSMPSWSLATMEAYAEMYFEWVFKRHDMLTEECRKWSDLRNRNRWLHALKQKEENKPKRDYAP